MKKIITLLAFGWFFSQTGSACGPFERVYLAENYFTFRACGDDMKGNRLDLDERNVQRIDNCKAWGKLTSPKIARTDIEDVVYRWNINKIQSLQKLIEEKLKYTGDNAFALWLVEHHDQETLNFLLPAKQCEQIRARQATVWYYPVQGDELSQQLEQVIQRAKEYSGKRLKDRYALQVIRALFSDHRYSQCVDYWNQNQDFFPESTLRDMAVDYVAGCFIRMDQREKATRLYAENGKGNKALQIKEGTPEEQFDWLYRYSPDDPCLLKQMQQQIHETERWESRWSENYHYRTNSYKPYYRRVEKICREKRCKNMAPWYYAMAFLSDKMGKPQQGMKYILKAEKETKDKDLTASVRVLKMYLKAKMAKKYDEKFEQYLYGELVWLDQLIEDHLDFNAKERIMYNGITAHLCGYSQYYWNDMMRKVLISAVTPLCIRSNYPTRALQYLNMADNRIFNLTRYQYDYDYSMDRLSDFSHFINIYQLSQEYKISWHDFRLAIDQPEKYVFNTYDYENDYFMNLDSIGVNTVKRLKYRMEHPVCAMDSFLTERSYTDPQFLNDIIGTQLIASMKYAEAVTYLEKVSKRFNQSRNVYGATYVDPFTMKERQNPDPFYRLHFAKQMVALEQQIDQSTDPNEKAELLLKYVYGMKSSINHKCYPLTNFYWGYFENFDLNSHYQNKLYSDIFYRAEELKEEAFSLFTDREKAAQAYYDWCMFKTAATRYPETKAARYIRGHCDVLRDYSM